MIQFNHQPKSLDVNPSEVHRRILPRMKFNRNKTYPFAPPGWQCKHLIPQSHSFSSHMDIRNMELILVHARTKKQSRRACSNNTDMLSRLINISLVTISRTFHSLFKVLFTFPSRYLFAIGFLSIFSFRWSLPPALNYTLKQFDSRSHGEPKAPAAPTGLSPSPAHLSR
jgi:hypothetical protein